jgi:hypothetical protein
MKNWKISFGLSLLAALAVVLLAPILTRPPRVNAQFAGDTRMPPFGFITGNPTIAITTGSATSAYQATTGATAAHIQWVFGTVSGTYSTCTVQAKTSFDGVNWLTLGSAAAVTVSSNGINAWDVYQQAPSTSGVTTTTPSSSAAVGFGAWTEYTFACSAYGTSAPVTISAIYK